MSEKVALFRTILGEDVIAKYDVGADSFVLEEALQIITQVKDNKIVLGFEPYIPLAQRPIQLNTNAVVAMSEARPELEAEFRRAISPILQPNQGIITPN